MRRTALNPVSRVVALAVGLHLLAGATSRAAEGAAPEPRRAPLTVASWNRVTPVDFELEVLPVFKRNCLACHNQTRAKGDLNLETPQTIKKGGATGPGLVPGKADESLVFKASAHRVEDMVMPPVGNKSNAADLTPEELALLKAWIDQGALGEVRGGVAVAWSSMPTNWMPSFAVAISPDGQFVAGGRANAVDVYQLSTRRRVARLEDPETPGLAHRDVVNALAFSPDGEWLASAGFRELKLWRKKPMRLDTDDVPVPSGPWSAQARSEDGLAQAAGTPSGTVLLLDAAGVPARTISVGTTPVQTLRFSPDRKRLAAVLENGAVAVIDLESALMQRGTISGPAPGTLFWPDQGREIAVAVRGEARLKRWRVPEAWTADGELSALPDREEGASPLVAAGNTGPLGTHGFVLGADGSLRVWAPGVATPVAQLPVGPPALAGAVSSDLRFAAVAGADGLVRVWQLGDTPKAVADASGDWALSQAVTNAAQSLAFLKSEIEYFQGASKRAEDEVKKTGEVLAKATAKSEENVKALAAKKAELKGHTEAKAAAEKEKGELAASLKAASDALAAAEAKSGEAKAAAGEAAEKSALTRTAAEQANRAKADLDRLVSDLTGKAEESAVQKARELSAASAAETLQKFQAAEAAKAQVQQRIDALAALAFAAGQAKAAQERAMAEIPPRQKQAEDKLAAATKAIADLDGPLKKAEIAVSTSEDDVTLARTQSERAKRELDDAKTALAAAEGKVPGATSLLEASRTALSENTSSPVTRVLLSRDGTTLVVARESGRVQAWDVSTGGQTEVWSAPASGAGVIALEMPEAQVVRVVTDRTASRHRIQAGWTWSKTVGAPAGSGAPAPGAFQDRVNAVVFRPDGRAVLTGGGEPTRGGELKLWSVPDGELLRDFGAPHSDAILALAFSPTGDQALSGGADRFMRLVDLGTGKVTRHFEGHTHHVMGVAWRRDGRTVASAGAEAVVKVWNRVTGDRLKNVDGFGKEVVSIQPVGISDQFLAVSGSGQARVFKAGGEQVRTLDAKGAFLHALAMTPDGRTAVAGDAKGVLRVWSVEDGKSVAELPLPTDGPVAVAGTGAP